MNYQQLKKGPVLIVGTSLLAALFLWGYIRPEHQKATRLQREIGQYQHEITEVPTRIAELKMLQDKVDQSQKTVSKKSQRMPLHVEPSKTLKTITQIAQRANLNIIRMNPLSPVPHASYQIVPFRLVIHGEFSSISAFLKDFESQKHLMTFDQVMIQQQDMHNKTLLQAEITFFAYSRLGKGGKQVEFAGIVDQKGVSRKSDFTDFAENNASQNIGQPIRR